MEDPALTCPMLLGLLNVSLVLSEVFLPSVSTCPAPPVGTVVGRWQKSGKNVPILIMILHMPPLPVSTKPSQQSAQNVCAPSSATGPQLESSARRVCSTRSWRYYLNIMTSVCRGGCGHKPHPHATELSHYLNPGTLPQDSARMEEASLQNPRQTQAFKVFLRQ